MNVVPVADTSEDLADFAPYVPCVAADGTVAFQATLRDGHHGVFAVSGGVRRTLADTHADIIVGRLASIDSHPALSRAGVCFYATRASGRRDLCLVHDGQLDLVTADHPELVGVGPLGPTMNETGTIAFRADLAGGGSGVFTARDGTLTRIASTHEGFTRFHGLPVIDAEGTVVFRADLGIGREGIYRWRADEDGEARAIAETGGLLSELGRFPALADDGRITFWAELTGGGAALFSAVGRELTLHLDTRGAYETFRGALPMPSGLLFYAVPRGGRLGVFTGPDPMRDRVLALGDPLFGATVTDFALNPVSVNARGQAALRVALSDGRQLILRADPGSAGA